MSMRRCCSVVALTKNQRFRGFSSMLLPTEARRLEGKVAVITGGASGIGEATTWRFVAHGAKVIVADVREEATHPLRPHVHFLRCDVSREDDVRRAVDFAVAEHGRLDIMFNNAGVPCHVAATPADVAIEDYERVMAVNARGVLLGVKHAARVMIATPGGSSGSILCSASIGSVVALKSWPVYTVSKHAVVGIVKSAAADLAQYGIRVNCVSPYGLATTIVMDAVRNAAGDVDDDCVAESMESCNDFKGVRFSVDDVADAAVFLCSDESRYISGHNLVIDGGFTAARDFNLLKAYKPRQT